MPDLGVSIYWEIPNWGLSPILSEKIGGNRLWKIGPFRGCLGPGAGPVGAFSGPIGTNSSTPHSQWGKSRNCPERALFGPIGGFRAKPPFAKPPFGFPCVYTIKAERAKGAEKSQRQLHVSTLHLSPNLRTLSDVFGGYSLSKLFWAHSDGHPHTEGWRPG